MSDYHNGGSGRWTGLDADDPLTLEITNHTDHEVSYRIVPVNLDELEQTLIDSLKEKGKIPS